MSGADAAQRHLGANAPEKAISGRRVDGNTQPADLSTGDTQPGLAFAVTSGQAQEAVS